MKTTKTNFLNQMMHCDHIKDSFFLSNFIVLQVTNK
jgi:hypothetical protein